MASYVNSFAECKEAFGWNLEQLLFFGGYPGTLRLCVLR